jgi:hypothetical protein
VVVPFKRLQKGIHAAAAATQQPAVTAETCHGKKRICT